MYIKKHYFFLILFLGFVIIYRDIVFAGAQKDKTTLEVRMDPRVELMSLIFHLAGNPKYNQVKIPSYQKAVRDYLSWTALMKIQNSEQSATVLFDGIIDFLAVNRYISWCFDSEADFVATDLDYHDLYLVLAFPYDDYFILLAA